MLKNANRARLGLDNLESREVCATLVQLGTIGDIVGVLAKHNPGIGHIAPSAVPSAIGSSPSATADTKPIGDNQRHIYFSIISVQNTTASPLRFTLQWGGSAVAQQYVLAPGKTMRFAFRQIERVNPDEMATIRVRSNPSDPKTVQSYRLASQLVQANANGGLPAGPGQMYEFQKSDAGIILVPKPPVIN